MSLAELKCKTSLNSRLLCLKFLNLILPKTILLNHRFFQW